jgi:hypothetical protein
MIADNLEYLAEPRLRLAGSDEAGVLADIGPYFRRQAARRLVVLGAAGAGKTVALLHLVLNQLEHRATLPDAARAHEPVPVRVNAAGWDGSANFTPWLANRLVVDYQLKNRVAEALIEDNRILPVIDGLDEMDPADAKPARASAALAGLNEPPWRNSPVLVACRSQVYAEIREIRGDAGLQFATTVTLQPFSPDDICNYLDLYLGDGLGITKAVWAPVTEQIDHACDGVLANGLRTPWMLSLAATALHRERQRVAIELASCRDTTEVRDLLFAALIPAAIQGTRRAGRPHSYTEQNVQMWLRTFAQYLQSRRIDGTASGTEIALNEVWAIAGTRRCRSFHELAAGLMVGLSAGLASGIAFGLLHGLKAGLASGLAVGLILMLFVVILLAYGDDVSVGRFAWHVPGGPRWPRGLRWGLAAVPVAWLLGGLGAGLVAGLKAGLTAGLITGVKAGLAIGLAGGLLVGLVTGFATSSEERLVLGQDAHRTIRDDIAAGLALGLGSGLAFGVASMVGAGLAVGHTAGQVLWTKLAMAGLVPAISIGLAAAVIFASDAGRYATASVVFRVTRTFPPRPAQFLDWARDAGLLRVTGIAYQFRHDTYGEWLTAGAGEVRSETVVNVDSD